MRITFSSTNNGLVSININLEPQIKVIGNQIIVTHTDGREECHYVEQPTADTFTEMLTMHENHISH